VKAAAGDEHDLDAARGGGRERIAVRVGQPAAAVEQRAVDVDGQDADRRLRWPVYFLSAVVQLSSTVIGVLAAGASAWLIRNLSPSGETSYVFRSLALLTRVWNRAR